MRILKILLLLCLSTLVISGCEKDSVQPKAGTHSKAEKTTQTEKKTAPEPEPAPKKEETQPVKTVEKAKPETKTADETKNETVKTTPKPSTTPPPPKKEPVAAITVQVIGYQGKSILSTTNVTLQQGDTDLTVTQRILKAKGIPISVRGSGASAYVEGINNEFEFDHGPMSGWIAYVNGKKIDRSAGSVAVKKGDQVVWKYSTDGKG